MATVERDLAVSPSARRGVAPMLQRTPSWCIVSVVLRYPHPNG